MFWLKNKTSILLLFAFSMPAIFVLFHPGFFVSDDGEWMIIRFSAFHQAFVDGQLPVRFLGRLNYGYGYPVANFLYPGFMYLAEIPKILGFGFVDSIKIILGLSMIASSVFSYLWLGKIFNKQSLLLRNNLPAFIGSLVYLYAPYHLFDLYKRGSIGEVLALAVAPFILWSIERKSFFWSSVGVAMLILSHNTLALLFSPMILIYMLFSLKIYQYTSILVIGLGLSSFFWIPAIFELPYTVFFQTRVSEWGRYFVSLNLIGLSTLVVFLFAIIFLLKPFQRSSLALFFLASGLIALFLALPISSFMWEFLPVSFVQFPFRFLSLSIISSAFLAALIVHYCKNNLKIGVSLAMFALLGFSAFPYIQPTIFFDKTDGYYATNEATTTVLDEYMPKWAEDKPTEHFQNKIEVVKGKGSIENLVSNSRQTSFNTIAQEDLVVRVNTIYYPGWRAFVDGQAVSIDYQNKKGVMDVFIQSGKHDVRFVFGETSLRFFADILSIFSFFILLGYGLFRTRTRLVKIL